MRIATRILVVAAVALIVATATTAYAVGAILRMGSVCSTEGFIAVHFEDWPDDGDVWTHGFSLFPPGAYCQMNDERVVQLFPRMPSDEELAEHGFG